MARVLLINPSYFGTYGNAKVGLINPVLPILGLATIAATTRKNGHKVEIFDLSGLQYNYEVILLKIKSFKPDVVGITATTPLMNQLRDISVLIKNLNSNIIVVAGGAHPSALPYETLMESMCDAVTVGESDYTFPEICNGIKLRNIKGIYYRDKNGNIFQNELRPLIHNLDELPMPAFDLYDVKSYNSVPKLLARRTPVTMVEFSRGCVFKCDFCASKITMAQGYRKKSPKRCAEEIKYIYNLGFKEFHLADDIFTSDQNWASEVCNEISNLNLDIIWTATNGIRVESANIELFNTMKRAGCYRVAFGFESGNDEVLKKFGKGGKASLKQGEEAVRLARKAGIDTVGFFMLGLSPDTESTMNDTIEFARNLSLDMLKFGITIAFPGTTMFNEGVKNKWIKSYNWDDYFIYTSKPLFFHPTLTNKQINTAVERGYKRAVLYNPRFWLQRFLHGIKTGEFFWDIYYFFKFIFLSATTSPKPAIYFSEEDWPKYDFNSNLPRPSFYQKVGAKNTHSIQVLESWLTNKDNKFQKKEEKHLEVIS